MSKATAVIAQELIDEAHSGRLTDPTLAAEWIGRATAILGELTWDYAKAAASARLTDA